MGAAIFSARETHAHRYPEIQTALGADTTGGIHHLIRLGHAIYLTKDFLHDGIPLGIDQFVESHRFPFAAINYIAI
jgi:hypothetical protein